MSWASSTVWWVVVGGLVAVELATGTFYLLMLALGAAAAAIAAHAGGGLSAQLVAAAVVGGGAVTAWHLRRQRQPPAPPAEANRDINLDIGTRVHVTAWNPDGTARVAYRGATWSARHGGPGTPQPGAHVIVAMQANELMLQRAD
ncbi:MAG TPA: NfeD family protein [Burkholderiaceae bacterium]|nr:NfeD family protein [Burkholderiaceae bacterium]